MSNVFYTIQEQANNGEWADVPGEVYSTTIKAKPAIQLLEDQGRTVRIHRNDALDGNKKARSAFAAARERMRQAAIRFHGGEVSEEDPEPKKFSVDLSAFKKANENAKKTIDETIKEKRDERAKEAMRGSMQIATKAEERRKDVQQLCAGRDKMLELAKKVKRGEAERFDLEFGCEQLDFDVGHCNDSKPGCVRCGRPAIEHQAFGGELACSYAIVGTPKEFEKIYRKTAGPKGKSYYSAIADTVTEGA